MPTVHGYVHADFEPVARALARQLADDAKGSGAAACVYHRGAKVVDIWSGARAGDGREWEEGTMALSFSTTKGVMSTLVHALVDRGVLDYDDRVAKHWPEFAQGGKADITLRQVLCHEAGLYPIRSLIDHADRMLDWEYMTRALARAVPVRAPRRGRSGYHGITYGWLVGEVARRATGRSLADLVRTELREPLGLDGFSIGASPGDRARLAELLFRTDRGDDARASTRPPPERPASTWRKVGFWVLSGVSALVGLDPRRTMDALLPRGGRDVFFSSRALDAEIPAFNGVFTARALARMYAMLAGGGELEGRRFLSAATVKRATEVHSRRLDAVVGFPMRWRLGYHVVGTSLGILPNAFGHFGYGGSGAWADPDRNLSVAMTLNRVAGTPFGDMRMVRIGGVAARCAERRR